MAVEVAEYLGIRTDIGLPIQPLSISKINDSSRLDIPCPFKNSHCDKAKRGDKPICSLRDSNTKEVWIVCSHRLCASSPKNSQLTSHQVGILHQVAKAIYSPDITPSEVLVKREAPIKGRKIAITVQIL